MAKSDYDRLRERVEELEHENAVLKAGENEANELIAFNSQLASEYKKLTTELKEVVDQYNDARRQLLNLRAEYKAEMGSLLDSVRSTVNSIKR